MPQTRTVQTTAPAPHTLTPTTKVLNFYGLKLSEPKLMTEDSNKLVYQSLHGVTGLNTD